MHLLTALPNGLREVKCMYIMKWMAIFLLGTCLSAAAAGKAQVITLNEKDKPLTKVFNEIRKQSGFNFLFSTEDLKLAKPVTVHVTNVPLEQALRECLHDQPFAFSIEDNSIIVKMVGVEKTFSFIDITGQVLNEEGSPVAATVKVKGTSNATGTDAAGNFTLKQVEENATLLVTGVAIEPTEVKVQGRKTLSIKTKKKVVSVDPVTVTAYGIERRVKEIGYSVATVSGTEINKANSGNLLTGLIGKVSGLNITSQSSDMSPQMRILLRGIRSFGQNSNNQPLFIFNGAPISFGTDQTAASQVMEFINNFNPADIEDVTILKGANGTALYGPEGVNGVIIITTKKAAKGAPVVNFRNNTSFQVVDFRQDRRQRVYGLGSGMVDANGNGIYDSRGVGSWGPKYDGSLVNIGYPDENGDLQQVTYSDKNDYRRFFNTAVTNRTNLSFAQSETTSSYYLGLGYVKTTGILPGDKQNQMNVLFNSSKKFGNKLNIQFNINYSRVNNDRGGNIEGTIRSMPTYIPLMEYKDYKNSYWGNHNRYYDFISPFEKLALARSKGTTNAVNGSLIFEVKPFDWLTIRDQPGLNYNGYYQKYTSEPINFLAFARQDYRKAYDQLPNVGEQMNSATSLNNDLIFSTIQKAGDVLFRVNVGNTIRQNYSKAMRAGAILVAPVYNLAFAYAGSRADEDAILSRTISAFGTASMGYREMLFLELTGRNEWDSKRAKVARGQDFYASANASLILNSLIPGLKKMSWINMARLRASVARSANMNISPYQSERILYLANGYPYVDPNTGIPLTSYSFLPNNPNPNLTPERVTSQEYGLNLGLWNNRVTADITYYHQINNSVILDVVNAYLSGYPTTDNAGRFQNHGWELDLNITPLINFSKNFNVSMQVRGALNANKVLSLTPVYKGVFPVFDPSGQRYFARTGNSAYEFAVTDWKRDAEGRVIVNNVTGMPTPEDFGNFAVKGNTLPRHSLSVTLNFNWKRWTASFFADYMGGYDHLFSPFTDFFRGTDPRTLYNDRQPYVFPNSVYDDGTGKYVPNTDLKTENANLGLYQNFAQVSMYGLAKANFLKLREVAFQYTLPVRTNFLKQVAFTAYGRDLLAFYHKSNLWGDPGLIRGPGFRDPTNTQSNISNLHGQNTNSIGGSSEDSSLPGSVLFGFTISATF